MTVEVLEPHGFCAGVKGALKKARDLAAEHGRERKYCLHELVHNELVVAELKAGGFVFVDDLNEVPHGAMVLFSAHGVGRSVREAAEARRLKVVDATCPFVSRVHAAVRDFADRGLKVVVIGNRNHAEVKGIVGEVDRAWVYPELPDDGPVGVVSQTTMNADEVRRIVDELKIRYELETVADVCMATKVRQDAVRDFDGDALLVLGSASSSNTRRLCEVAACRTFRAGTMDEVRALDLAGIERLGLTSGASTPEEFFEEVLEWLRLR